MNGLA